MRHLLRSVAVRPAALRSARGIANAAAADHSHSHDIPPSLANPAPEPENVLRPTRFADAKPFSEFLTDSFSRQHDYLRISITEKCNLRCTYCMPEEGVPLSPSSHLLTTPEIVYLSDLFVSQGVTKIRLTGGEPTIRKDIVPLVQSIGDLRRKGLKEMCLTTNGIALHRKLDSMVEAGLTGVNLSLDTLDPWQFQIMTRRKGFDAVMRSMDRILEMNKLGAGVKLKVNCVVMRGVNDRDILSFVELGREKDIEVRFIEYMPFDGNKWNQSKMMGYNEMLGLIRERYGDLRKVKDHKNDTSKTFQVPGFTGKIGFITSMTHNFCGTCNRLRITSDGNLKVCLFGNAEVSLRDTLRKANGGNPFDEEAMRIMRQAEMHRDRSRSGILDQNTYSQTEAHLLDVIGMAVKRKKEKHAGLGVLEKQKNRPMILIDEQTRAQHATYTCSELFNAQQKIVPRISHKRRAGGPPLWTPASVPLYLLKPDLQTGARLLSSKASSSGLSESHASLPHLNPKNSEVHQVSVSAKAPTHRTALAIGHVRFSSPATIEAIRSHLLKKGDVLAVARIGAIQALKDTARTIVLAHAGIGVEGCLVEVVDVDGLARKAESTLGSVDENQVDQSERLKQLNEAIGEHGGVRISVQVETTAKTGVEMEALTGVMGAALNVVDMVKSVDREISIEGVKVIGKKGGKSGGWGLWANH